MRARLIFYRISAILSLVASVRIIYVAWMVFYLLYINPSA